MHVILVAATSQDGFIASDAYPHPDAWTSTEDKARLRSLVEQHKLLIFGKNTYEIYGKIHSPGTLRVVLARNPDDFANDVVPGELEFVSATAQELVKQFEADYPSCLVLGGAYVYQQFIEAGLVDEIYLTVEPIEMGEGKRLLASGQLLDQAISLPEPTIAQLNDNGTLLKHYRLNR